jgi:pyruvate kinase
VDRLTPEALLDEMRRLRAAIDREAKAQLGRWRPLLRRRAFRASAVNLSHYLALRRRDLRALQAALVPWGLSSLGRAESRVMASLDAVIASLAAICRQEGGKLPERPPLRAFQRGTQTLARNTDLLLGPASGGRKTRIMVTVAKKAAESLDHVRTLVRAGMDCARINCAHDDPATWAQIIANLRLAGDEAGRNCRVLMDLAGPKVRTEQVLKPKDNRPVQPGDRILITYATPARDDSFPYQASCSLPDALHQVGVGAPISIKDGLISGRVEALRPEGVVMNVTRTGPDGEPLRSGKGINFPGTALSIDALTEQDLSDLDFIAENADIVSYSFVQRPEDIARLQAELETRRPGLAPLPIVAKIETKLAFANLPELIVQAAGANPFAVMIARGDLAIEIGFERLSEVQEEILWLCEAAHVPVIWATQVLESLVKRGMPSRAEYTDAAMSTRAECVMLNKGPYVADAVAVLADVFRRMEAHQIKKMPQLRALAAWQRTGAPFTLVGPPETGKTLAGD